MGGKRQHRNAPLAAAGARRSRKSAFVLPPALPPETPDEEFQVSDEDMDFFNENPEFTDFLTRIDKKQIDRHVTRVADKSEDEVERLYEKRNRNAAPLDSRESDFQVDPVDALPIKTLDGKLQYRTSKKMEEKTGTESNGEGDDEKATNLIRLTKAERRQQLKKEKKEAKKLNKDEEKAHDSPKNKLNSEVLKEVEEEISAEESFGMKKIKLAEIGMALLEDPESNIRSLRDLLQICEDKDPEVVKLGLMSMLAVFKDIIPSYRIRELTEKELAMQVSEAVRKTRYYEYTLLRSYKAYLQKLVALQKKASFKQVAVRCMCTLLEAAPHFNFCETLLAGTVRNISSSDDVIRKLCCEAIKYLFKNEGKHGGEATVRAVRLIAQLVKTHDCQLHPDCIYVFLSLRFDEDLGKNESKTEEKTKFKKNKKGMTQEPTKQLQPSERKKSKQELIAKTRQEVYADYKAVSFAPDSKQRQRMQTDTLSAVFETYFRILKHAVDSSDPRSNTETSVSHAHPLLAPCLEGLGKFSHFIDLDFMADLMSCLKQLSGFHNGAHLHSRTSNTKNLTVSERLQCCIVAFKIMKSNLDALNIDLQDFFVQLYNLLLEFRPHRDRGEVLAEALKTMLWDGRQHDMQRAAAFIKRLATFSLSFGTAESMSALATLKQLLQKNSKCRSLLENDAGGGSISGLIVVRHLQQQEIESLNFGPLPTLSIAQALRKYQPEATDPYLSGALASVLWELSLLSKHYNPNVSQMASNILSMANLKPGQNIVNPTLTALNPIQAFSESTMEKELCKPMNTKVPPSLKHKRKREVGEYFVLDPEKIRSVESKVIGEEEAKVRFEEHFKVLRDISENERLKGELNRTLASISLFDEFKRERSKKERSIGLKIGNKKAKVLVT